jgi:glyoxylase-like metal-dependent hydrolase (beta-lactamase superfamily II)
MPYPTVTRRTLIAGLAGAAALASAGLPRNLRAQTAPAARPILYDRKIGDLTLTTILDGYFPLTPDLLVNAAPDVVSEGYAAAYVDPAQPMKLPIVAYVVTSGTETTLIDAGAGLAFGPTSGHLGATLAAGGIAPASVTRIALTHMHPDHVGGLLEGEAAAFPNASLHVSKTDLGFWTDESIAAGVPDGMKPFFALARGVAAAYGDRVIPFDGEADLGGGLSTIPLPGHTPGHSGLRLSSGGDGLVIWGDAAIIAALQFTHPDVGIAFDADPALAATTRRALLDMAATDRLRVAGTHLPFPGAGHVEKSGDAYAWVPEPWQFL